MTGLIPAIRLVAANSRPQDPGKLSRESINEIPVIGRGSERKGKSCPLVALHGVTPEGEHDPRMVRFLGGLASAGVDAYAPRLEGMASGVVMEKDVRDITRVVEEVFERSGSKVGIIGFSVGGGYALLAAAGSRLQGKLAFVCSVGGYARLRDMVQGFFEVFGDDGEDEGWARVVCFYSFSAKKRLSASEFEVMGRMAQLPCGRSRIGDLTALADGLKEEGRKIFDALLQREEWVRDIVLEDLESSGMEGPLSPADHVEGINCPVYLLHGLHDPTISWEQTAALERTLLTVAKPPARSRVSGSFGHVQPGKIYSVVSQFQDLLFFASLLKHALQGC